MKYFFCGIKLVLLALIILSLHGMLTLHAQETEPAADVVDSAADKPDLDLNTAEFVELQSEYRAARQKLTGGMKSALEAIIEKHLAKAEEMYEDRKRSGNVRGMGIARDYKKIFTDAQEQLVEKGDFDFPKRIRRELTDMIEQVKQEKAAACDPINPQLEELEREYLGKFNELAQQRAESLEIKFPDEQITAKFAEFKEKELKIPEPEKKTAAVDGVPPSEIDRLMPPAESDDVPLILASSGNGARWVTVCKWTAEMMGMDVLMIECGNKKSDYTETKYHPIAGADSKLKYQAVNALPPRDGYVYRLKRIDGMGGVDSVLEWPSAKNAWTLVIRIRTTGSLIPAKHGFELQVSLPGDELASVFGKDAINAPVAKGAGAEPGVDGKAEEAAKEEDKGPKVKVAVRTKPEAVRIYVDGVLQRHPKDGHALSTPTNILVAQGVRNIRLAKKGYLDKEFKSFDAQPGKRIVWELLPHPDAEIKTITLKANSRGWYNTGVTAEPGQTVYIEADGQWTCGDRRDRCGPDGLPNNATYYKYYINRAADLRQDFTKNYGALLVRIGSDGPIEGVGNEGAEMKVSIAGEILLDINEKPDIKARRNNTGQLSVSVVLMP